MTNTGKLYYLAAVLALIAAGISVFTDGFVRDEYLHVGLLVALAAAMLWIGYRTPRKPVG